MKVKLIDNKGFVKTIEVKEKTKFIEYMTWQGMVKFELNDIKRGRLIYKEII